MILAIFLCLFTTDLKVLKTEPRGLELEFRLNQYRLETVNINGQIFQKIELSNQSSVGKIGQPDLPLIVEALAIPNGSQVSLEIISAKYQEIEIEHQIIPHQKPEVDGNDNSEFVIDKEFYQKDIFFPEKIVEISQPMIWRNLKIVQLKIAPVLYNPVLQKIRVYKTIRLRINFSQPFATLDISPKWLNLYQGIIFNFSQVPYQLTRDNDFYLMVVHQNFVNSINQLIDFYQSHNFQVEKLIVDDSWTPEQIKAEILKRYQNNSLDWVLLVGDAEHIKPYWYKEEDDSLASDSYYSFLEGDDYYAEIGVGRLSGKTSEEISHQVEKILYYQESAQGWWLNKTILIAHKEEYPDKYSACKREIYNTEYSFFQPEMDTLFGACGITNQDVIEAINEGVGIVNYRGHGSTYSWSNWCGSDWRAQEINQLENDNMTPIVFNIACLNHKFYWANDCLGETWLKKYPIRE